MVEWWNSRTAEWRNHGAAGNDPKPQKTESQNGGKSPEILKDGTMKNPPKPQKTERRKITQIPKRRNDGKSPNMAQVCETPLPA